MVKKSEYEIRNVIICDDVREEIGNKKSLMGVLGGDILVPELPAQIQLAIYFEFMPAHTDGTYKLMVTLCVDNERIAKVELPIALQPGSPHATIVLPKGIILFEKESSLRVLAKVDEDEELEIAKKKIILRPGGI